MNIQIKILFKYQFVKFSGRTKFFSGHQYGWKLFNDLFLTKLVGCLCTNPRLSLSHFILFNSLGTTAAPAPVLNSALAPAPAPYPAPVPYPALAPCSCTIHPKNNLKYSRALCVNKQLSITCVWCLMTETPISLTDS